MRMACMLRFQRNKFVNMNLLVFALIVPLFVAPVCAEDTARGDGGAAGSQAGANATPDQARRDSPEEEFKFRYKKPKQRHDDDEAPVPKIVNPAQVDSPPVSEKK
jgi:hypothetical protein